MYLNGDDGNPGGNPVSQKIKGTNRLECVMYTFDTGPTLLVMPLLYEAEFAALGVDLRDLLELKRVDPTYRLVSGRLAATRLLEEAGIEVHAPLPVTPKPRTSEDRY